MTKLIFATILTVFLGIPSFAQLTTNDIVQRKVDSLKNKLRSVKANERVDYLNMICEGYVWIYDDDTENLLDSACVYAGLAFREATKLRYKTGLGYATLQMAHCEAGRADTNKGPNSYFIRAEKIAKQAIAIGEELQDNILIARSYGLLNWMERWKGSPEKSRDYLQKAIIYYEKPLNSSWNKNYRELEADCSKCLGNEFALGNLYLQLSGITPGANENKIILIEKAIANFQKLNSPSDLGRAYASYANSIIFTKGLDIGIEYLMKAIKLYHDNGNEHAELDAYISLASFNYNKGDFENGILYNKKSILLAQKLAGRDQKNFRLAEAYVWMARFYSIANDFQTAFSYLAKAKQYYPPRYDPHWRSMAGEIHRLAGNYDSAHFYLDANLVGTIFLLNLYNNTGEYDKSLALVEEAKKRPLENSNFANLGRIYTASATAWYGKAQYAKALMNATQGLHLLKKTTRNVNLLDNYQLLSDIYYKLGKFDSAYIYLKQFSVLKDSLLNRQLYIRLNDYKKEAEEIRRSSQILLLQKDNLLQARTLQQILLLKEQKESRLALMAKTSEIKDQELLIRDQQLREQILFKQQSTAKLDLLDKENKIKDQRINQQRFLKNALIAGFLLFFAAGGFLYRSINLKRRNEKLKSEKQKAELHQKASELEMQALRAQMNPHFIFNCLNSINRFIFKNETRAACDYLTGFSRLIRMVLLHSQKKLIPLEDELEMLRLYLNMERLRFKDAFNYHIKTTNSVENQPIFIPPLLLQPFCENAIWHGLMHKDGPGHLNIELSENNDMLNCVITDDGVGMKKAAEFRSKSATQEKSFGLKITRERLSLLNTGTTGQTFYKMEDVLDEQGEVAGTRVKLDIYYKQTVEETV